jgi:hypothetical protein
MIGHLRGWGDETMTEDAIFDMLQEMVKDIGHRYRTTTGKALDLVIHDELYEALERIIPTDCLLEN